MVLCRNKGHFRDREDRFWFWIPHALFMLEITLESSVQWTLQIAGWKVRMYILVIKGPGAAGGGQVRPARRQWCLQLTDREAADTARKGGLGRGVQCLGMAHKAARVQSRHSPVQTLGLWWVLVEAFTASQPQRETQVEASSMILRCGISSQRGKRCTKSWINMHAEKQKTWIKQTENTPWKRDLKSN